MEADSFKAVKKAAGVDDSSVLTESLVPQIDLSQYKLPHTDKERPEEQAFALCVGGACQKTQLSSITALFLRDRVSLKLELFLG